MRKNSKEARYFNGGQSSFIFLFYSCFFWLKTLSKTKGGLSSFGFR